VTSTNIEKGRLDQEPNRGPADASDELRAYFARKRSVCASSLILIVPAAALAAAAAPVLGFDLLLGVACGIAYALLLMHANERLGGRQSLGAHARNSVLRVFAFGAVPVVTAVIGPVWGMGLYFAGFFTPLVMYALAVRGEIAKEASCRTNKQ
jgi:hypothetical protein